VLLILQRLFKAKEMVTLGKLFGSSGVRGLVNVVLTPALSCQVGMATAIYAKARKAIVARDTRVSGQMVEDALVSGLSAAGTNVTLLGTMPTPAVAYLTKTQKADVGFMITASHNPPQYNGIKIFSPDSLSYTDISQDGVEKIITQRSFNLVNWRSVGQATAIDLSYLYSSMLQNAVRLHKPWKVVVDPGCGAAYDITPKVFNAVGCKTTAINAQADGYFPARTSEPTAESLKDLSKIVCALGADLGVAFDGDADRVAFVDDDGKFADFDRVLAAYCAYKLKSNKGGIVVTTVEASMCVETMAAKYDGKVIRSKVGDVYVSEAISRFGAVFGGEPCGAWVHPQLHYCPDGPLSAVLILQALEDEGKSLRDFISEVPEYVTLREKVAVKNEQKYLIVDRLSKSIVNDFEGYGELSTVDGIRLALHDGWLLIRASGTEPLIRVTVEGESLKAARDIMNKSITLIKAQVQEGEKV
jgi:phosphoglucosamine mutase